MTTCKDCFFPAELPHDCSGDMGDLQTTRTVIQFTRRELYAHDKVLREQIAREIEQHCINIGHWHEPNMPCQVHERAAAIARGEK